MKKISAALSIVCFLLISSAASGGERIIYSGTFTRERGKPGIAVDSFRGKEGPATFRVSYEGDKEESGKKVKVSFITLNGETLFRHIRFHKRVRQLEKKISLERNNVLEVLLKGKPGGKIEIHITQSDVHTLTVLMDGTGSGRVTSSPEGIFCEKECEEAFDDGTQVTLTASPYSGNTFAGWAGGGCGGTGTCTVTTSSDTAVTAIFDLSGSDPFTLITPYVHESDMKEIRNIFNTWYHPPPWGQVHDGLDIYPKGDLKPFRASCAGRVQRVVTLNDMVFLNIRCDSPYSIEYNFEPQAPDTGGAQRGKILVDEGDTVFQGQLIGHLFDANPGAAHVHFTLNRSAVPVCPEPYFLWDDKNSIENLIGVAHQDPYMCSGPAYFPPALFTPYVDEFDMKEIRAAFSSEYSTSPWGFVHEGIDIYPKGDMKSFQAACSGIVDSLELRKSSVDSNWLVDLLIQCDDYVPDPLDGGYFIPYSTHYVFKPMSHKKKEGKIQLKNIMVSEGQQVFQGDIIGKFHDVDPGKGHVHFGLVQYGSSFFTAFGVTGIPLCPEPHFSAGAKTSILNLLHVFWPSASICYQE